jgi:hypothetical protein
MRAFSPPATGTPAPAYAHGAVPVEEKPTLPGDQEKAWTLGTAGVASKRWRLPGAS